MRQLISFAGERIANLVMLTRYTGAGESGKSTIIKQMRIIHSRGFPEEERHQTRAVIYSNIVVAFKVLLDIMNAENIDFEDANTQVKTTFSLPFISCSMLTNS